MSAFAQFFQRLFSSDFIPQGQCYFWQPALVWLHAFSDGLITLAYYSIPFTLLWLVRRRAPLRLGGVVVMLAGFALACGTTHLVSIWNLWHSTYRLEGVIKAVTALLSVTTAIVTIRFAPALLKLASPNELEGIKRWLRQEVASRSMAEEKLHWLMQRERSFGEGRLRTYFEAASQAIMVVSRDGRIAAVNGRTEEMFGYTREELMGAALEMLLPARFAATHAGHRHEFFLQPHMRTMGAGMALAGRRKDGTEFPVEIGLGYLETEEGVQALGLVTDITDRKRPQDGLSRTDHELRATERQLHAYLDANPQAIVAVSRDGRIVLVNRRTEEMFGYSRDELLGREMEMLLPERYRAAHLNHRAGFFAEPSVRPMGPEMELVGLRKDGSEFPVEIDLSFIESEGGTLSLGLVSDITRRKRAADLVALTNAELRRSNAELEQFAYIASHDLQEPLRMISSYMRLLQRRYRGRLDQEADEFIHYAVDGANRMKALIRDFLSVSRIGTQAVRIESVAAAGVVQDALSNLQASIQESGAIVTVDPLPSILADAGLLTQVFQNLIGNAIKFRRDGQARVNVSAILRNGDWVFSVSDNGIGVEPHQSERIFRIFERLDDSKKYAGSGIGLAVSKKIVERHGGRMWLDSNPCEGAVFSFSIPVEKAAALIKRAGA